MTRTRKVKETYYKVLNADGTCYHGGQGAWHLPQGARPGKWMPKIQGELRPCANGYHILRADQLIEWIAPVAVFIVETRGDAVVWNGNKGVVREARIVRRLDAWTEQTARLFACDCAEHLRESLDSSEIADFDACLLAIRRYAFGMANDNELEGARARAGAGARAWARAGARAWARAGARAWARAWAWAGAGAWAWAGAGAPEREWNTARLFGYLNGQVDIEAIKRSVTP